MPPKPWETRVPSSNISEIIQSNPTIKEQIIKQPPTSQPITANTTNDPLKPNTTTALASPYSSYGLGGYSSGYGGLGSSYGMGTYGMGGYGMGSYGMGGLGGLGGYGRYGMMGSQNQPGFLTNSLMTLQSFGYLINILCEIARSLDTNYQGLHLFYNSFKNLGSKTFSGTINGFKWIGNNFIKFFVWIFQQIKKNIFFLRNTQSKSKYKAISISLKIFLTIFVISLYPLLKKGKLKVF